MVCCTCQQLYVMKEGFTHDVQLHMYLAALCQTPCCPLALTPSSQLHMRKQCCKCSCVRCLAESASLLAGLTLIADESDAMWSSKIKPESQTQDLRSQREAQLYELLGSVLTEDMKPLSQGSRVRCFVQVDCLPTTLPAHISLQPHPPASL